jgi:integrase
MRGSVKKDGKSWYYVIDVGTNGKRKQKKQRNLKLKRKQRRL